MWGGYHGASASQSSHLRSLSSNLRSLSSHLIFTFCELHIFKLSIFTSSVFTPEIFHILHFFTLNTQIFSLPKRSVPPSNIYMYVCHSIIYLPLHSLLTTVGNWLWLTVLLWLMIDDVIYNTVTIIYQKSTSNSTSSVKLFFKLFRRLNALRPYRTWWLTLLPPESQNPKTPNTIK